MAKNDPQTLTHLLQSWRSGDSQALERLMPLVYDELKQVAAGLMRSERSDHTLQATAVIHEAYLRMAGSEVRIEDRGHFFSLAAQMMRRVLVDHARGQRRQKRGGDAVRVSLLELDGAIPNSADRLIEIDQALSKLEELDPRKSKALVLSLFGGLTQPEIAVALEVSESTVERDLRMARSWLRTELSPD